MKKLIFTLLFFLSLSTTCKAQLTYNNVLTYERSQYATYETTWGGWAHYWGSNDNVGIKMHIHSADPRMSTTTNKLVFYDTDRDLYIDLYCRTLYQTSDEKMKTNIRPLKARTFLQSPRTINIGSPQSNSITSMVLKLNPVKFQWKDAAQYERYNIRPKSGVEEYGFLAQELENIVPGAVAMTAEGDRLVNYSALIPILTAAIQELNDRVATLEAQLHSLKTTK